MKTNRLSSAEPGPQTITSHKAIASFINQHSPAKWVGHRPRHPTSHRLGGRSPYLPVARKNNMGSQLEVSNSSYSNFNTSGMGRTTATKLSQDQIQCEALFRSKGATQFGPASSSALGFSYMNPAEQAASLKQLPTSKQTLPSSGIEDIFNYVPFQDQPLPGSTAQPPTLQAEGPPILALQNDSSGPNMISGDLGGSNQSELLASKNLQQLASSQKQFFHNQRTNQYSKAGQMSLKTGGPLLRKTQTLASNKTNFQGSTLVVRGNLLHKTSKRTSFTGRDSFPGLPIIGGAIEQEQDQILTHNFQFMSKATPDKLAGKFKESISQVAQPSAMSEDNRESVKIKKASLPIASDYYQNQPIVHIDDGVTSETYVEIRSANVEHLDRREETLKGEGMANSQSENLKTSEEYHPLKNVSSESQIPGASSTLKEEERRQSNDYTNEPSRGQPGQISTHSPIYHHPEPQIQPIVNQNQLGIEERRHSSADYIGVFVEQDPEQRILPSSAFKQEAPQCRTTSILSRTPKSPTQSNCPYHPHKDSSSRVQMPSQDQSNQLPIVDGISNPDCQTSVLQSQQEVKHGISNEHISVIHTRRSKPGKSVTPAEPQTGKLQPRDVPAELSIHRSKSLEGEITVPSARAKGASHTQERIKEDTRHNVYQAIPIQTSTLNIGKEGKVEKQKSQNVRKREPSGPYHLKRHETKPATLSSSTFCQGKQLSSRGGRIGAGSLVNSTVMMNNSLSHIKRDSDLTSLQKHSSLRPTISNQDESTFMKAPPNAGKNDEVYQSFSLHGILEVGKQNTIDELCKDEQTFRRKQQELLTQSEKERNLLSALGTRPCPKYELPQRKKKGVDKSKSVNALTQTYPDPYAEDDDPFIDPYLAAQMNSKYKHQNILLSQTNIKSLTRLKMQKKMSMAKRKYEKQRAGSITAKPKQQFSTYRPVKQVKINRKAPEVTIESSGQQLGKSPYRQIDLVPLSSGIVSTLRQTVYGNVITELNEDAKQRELNQTHRAQHSNLSHYEATQKQLLLNRKGNSLMSGSNENSVIGAELSDLEVRGLSARFPNDSSITAKKRVGPGGQISGQQSINQPNGVQKYAEGRDSGAASPMDPILILDTPFVQSAHESPDQVRQKSVLNIEHIIGDVKSESKASESKALPAPSSLVMPSSKDNQSKYQKEDFHSTRFSKGEINKKKAIELRMSHQKSNSNYNSHPTDPEEPFLFCKRLQVKDPKEKRTKGQTLHPMHSSPEENKMKSKFPPRASPLRPLPIEKTKQTHSMRSESSNRKVDNEYHSTSEPTYKNRKKTMPEKISLNLLPPKRKSPSKPLKSSKITLKGPGELVSEGDSTPMNYGPEKSVTQKSHEKLMGKSFDKSLQRHLKKSLSPKRTETNQEEFSENYRLVGSKLVDQPAFQDPGINKDLNEAIYIFNQSMPLHELPVIPTAQENPSMISSFESQATPHTGQSPHVIRRTGSMEFFPDEVGYGFGKVSDQALDKFQTQIIYKSNPGKDLAETARAMTLRDFMEKQPKPVEKRGESVFSSMAIPVSSTMNRLLNFGNKSLMQIKEKQVGSQRDAAIRILKHHEISGHEMDIRLGVFNQSVNKIKEYIAPTSLQDNFKQDPLYLKKRLSETKVEVNPNFDSQRLLQKNGIAYGSSLGPRLPSRSSYRVNQVRLGIKVSNHKPCKSRTCISQSPRQISRSNTSKMINELTKIIPKGIISTMRRGSDPGDYQEKVRNADLKDLQTSNTRSIQESLSMPNRKKNLINAQIPTIGSNGSQEKVQDDMGADFQIQTHDLTTFQRGAGESSPNKQMLMTNDRIVEEAYSGSQVLHHQTADVMKKSASETCMAQIQDQIQTLKVIEDITHMLHPTQPNQTGSNQGTREVIIDSASGVVNELESKISKPTGSIEEDKLTIRLDQKGLRVVGRPHGNQMDPQSAHETGSTPQLANPIYYLRRSKAYLGSDDRNKDIYHQNSKA